MAAKKLYRIRKGRWLGGVCTGLAEYFNIDVSLVRILMVILALADGVGLLFYLIAWIVIPAKDTPEEIKEESGNEGSAAKIAIGITLLILGIIFFVNQFIYIFSFGKLWPLVLIALGVYFLVTASTGEEKRRKEEGEKDED